MPWNWTAGSTPVSMTDQIARIRITLDDINPDDRVDLRLGHEDSRVRIDTSGQAAALAPEIGRCIDELTTHSRRLGAVSDGR